MKTNEKRTCTYVIQIIVQNHHSRDTLNKLFHDGDTLFDEYLMRMKNK